MNRVRVRAHLRVRPSGAGHIGPPLQQNGVLPGSFGMIERFEPSPSKIQLVNFSIVDYTSLNKATFLY